MTDRAEARTSRRVLRFAVLGSLLVHVVGIFLWGIANGTFPNLQPRARATPPPDLIVTTSNAITIRKRAKPRPVPQPRVRPAQPQRVAAVQPRSVPRPELRQAPVTVPPLSRALHELAKANPQAAPQAPRTVRATPSPAPEPTHSAAAQPQRVAFAQQPSRPSRAHLSQEQLAHINEDIHKTLAQLRSENDPLAVHSTAPPVAQKRYRVQMLGAFGHLRNGEGHYSPIRSWNAEGYHYYYVSYDFVYSDGEYESGSVPWPIRFKPSEDPFTNPEIGARHDTPLPPPLPGWSLPPGEHIGKALVLNFPELQGQASQ